MVANGSFCIEQLKTGSVHLIFIPNVMAYQIHSLRSKQLMVIFLVVSQVGLGAQIVAGFITQPASYLVLLTMKRRFLIVMRAIITCRVDRVLNKAVVLLSTRIRIQPEA